MHGQQIIEGFKKKFNDDYYTMETYAAITMLSEAMKKAKSTDPVKVALRDGGPEVADR